MLSWLVTDSGRKAANEAPPITSTPGGPGDLRDCPAYVPTEEEALANEACETLESSAQNASDAQATTEEEAAASPALRRSTRKRRAASVEKPYARKIVRKPKMSTLRRTPLPRLLGLGQATLGLKGLALPPLYSEQTLHLGPLVSPFLRLTLSPWLQLRRTPWRPRSPSLRPLW